MAQAQTADGSNKLDSHADTCVAGGNMVVLEHTGTTVDVNPYTPEYNALTNIEVATCATAVTCPTTGQNYVLVFGQMLHFGDQLPYSLLCPNQICSKGHTVDDTPRQFDPKSTHLITFRDYNGNPKLTIPLEVDGVISTFCSRLPTQDELDHLEKIVVTDEHQWDPHLDKLALQEQRTVTTLPLLPQVTIASVSIADGGRLHER